MFKRFCAAILLLIFVGCGMILWPEFQKSPLTWRLIPIQPQRVDLDTSTGGYVLLADFDGDGYLDAASGFVSSGAVTLHIQSGADSWSSHILADRLGAVRSLSAGDFNDSGQLDLVAATDTGLWMLIAPGFAGPTFQSWSRSKLADPIGAERWDDVTVAHLDELPEPEIIATSADAGAIVVWRASGVAMTADAYRPFVIASGLAGGFTRLAVADVDGDGDLDIIAVGPDGGLIWLENPGPAGITGKWPVHRISHRRGLTRLVAADLDLDGDADIAVTDLSGGQVLWYENPGSPRTDPWGERLAATVFPGQPDAISVADMEGDGVPDLLVGTVGTNQSIFRLRQFNDPRQRWQVQRVAQPGFDIGELPVGDIDRTGGLDFAATLGGSKTPVVWFQQQ